MWIVLGITVVISVPFIIFGITSIIFGIKDKDGFAFTGGVIVSITFGVLLTCIIGICFLENTTKSYYAVNLTSQQECRIAELADSHHLIRSVEIGSDCLQRNEFNNNVIDNGLNKMSNEELIAFTKSGGIGITKVTFKVRNNDIDNLSRYVKELDFTLYKSEKSAKKSICESLNGQWSDKMNQCLECK